jgi:chorismate mutase
LEISSLHTWIGKAKQPVVIAGPCSAENRDQLLQTVGALASTQSVDMIRAGLWKPRTRPDGFEGVGKQGLEWLSEAKKLYGLPFCTEVATPEHIEMALKYGADALWIGARTTVNPFSVQILADALRSVDIAVMVKNPLHPDLKLWIGAIERISNAGITKLAAIHRGFYTYDNKPYRNLPMWEIPIELKRLLPQLPVFTDPSHISGNRSLIAGVAQRALDLSMDGLMIESHIDPDCALTDAAQQITPQQLLELLEKLVIRHEFGNTEFENKLEKLRFDIDQLDHELMNILARRNEKNKQIGHYKKENGITVLQMDRLRKMIQERMGYGMKLNLDPSFVLKLLQLVHKESVRLQTNIMQSEDENEG